MRFVPRFAISCLFLLGPVEARLYGQLLVPPLVRQFNRVPGLNLRSDGMAQAAPGHLWIASDDGIARFDGRQFRVFHDPRVKKDDYYYHVLPTPDGRVWLKMGRGYSLSYVDPRQQCIVRLPDTTRLVRDYLARYGFHCLFADAHHTLWIGLKKKGLLRVNTQTFAVEHLVDQSLDIRGITQDRRGTVYFTTVDQGLFAYAPLTRQLTNFRHRDQDTTSISSDTTYGVQARPDGSILVGLVNEANVLSPTTGQFRRLQLNSVRSPTPKQRSYIYEFMLDQQGNAYFSTGPAAFRYTAQGTLQRIGFGFPTDYIDALYVGPTNRLWVSAANQLFEYDLNRARTVPSLIFLSVVVNGTHLENNTTATQRLVYDTLGHPTLTVKENDQVRLRFSLMASKRSHTIRYRLDGYDKAWHVSENFEGTASYQLPAGTYTFRVNRGRHTGGWEPATTTMTVVIVPPFWKTTYALLLVLMLVGGVGYNLIRTYRRRRQLREQLALEKLEAANLRHLDELKTRFFTNITHEFRTPLALILAPTQQMASENPEPKNRRRLQTIEQNAYQLLGLINQLLDLSKLEASVMPIHESRGNLIEFIRHWLNPLTDQAAAQGLSLTFDTDVTGDYWFDAEKLERIVYNLLSNALKFTKAGTITVSLTDVSGRIRLTVADTGVGIPDQHLPHIFDRFYQVGPRSGGGAAIRPVGTPQPQSGIDASATPGTGIGLALVQELVQLQGGQISVESQLNQGTTFVVELPYKPVDMSEVTPDGVAPWYPEANADIWTVSDEPDEPRLLVVEDNDELARFIAESLPQNYRIRLAVNGRDGLEQALEHLPDLIISDVMMPLMDGFTLCGQLKTDLRTSHIPIILLTAKSSVESRLTGLALGADDYLTKPFQLTELRLRVRNQLVSKQRQREWVQASLRNPDPASPQLSSEPTDPFLTRLYALFDASLSDSGFGLEQLMGELGMSRTNLFRKVKALTGLTAHEMLRNYRLKQAAQLLTTGVSISETAYQVGFESASYFSKCFRDLYQVSPSEFTAQA